jgi:hypothetical protein
MTPYLLEILESAIRDGAEVRLHHSYMSFTYVRPIRLENGRLFYFERGSGRGARPMGRRLEDITGARRTP